MKRTTVLLFLLMPAMAVAQNYQGMSEADMQKMMQQMQEAQTCMEGIDQSQLEALEQQGRKMESEIKSLCADGKRDAAQREAMAFAKEMNDNPDIRKMRECGEKMRGMMPAMPYMDEDDESGEPDGHVCD